MLMLPTLPYFCAVTHLLPALRLPQTPKHDLDPEDEEEDEGPGGEYADGEGDPCPNCGRIYRSAFVPLAPGLPCGARRAL